MIQSGYSRGEKSLFAGIVLIAALMLVSSVFAHFKTLRLREGAARISRAHDTLVAVKGLLLRVQDAENEQRDFLLTGDPRQLDSFNAAAVSVDRGVQLLMQTASHDTDQASRADTMKSRIGNAMKALREGIVVRQQQGAGAARELALDDPAKERLNSVQIMADRMIRAEEAVFDEVSAAAKRSYGTIVAIRLVSLAVILSVLGAMAYQLHCSVAFRSMATSVIREQTERLQVTLGSIADGVITTDIAGRVVYSNAVAESLTGWRQAEAAGERLESILRLVDESSLPLGCPWERVKLECQTISFGHDALLIARDGTQRPIDGSAAPITHEDGSVIGSVLVFRDVSGRKRIEQELKQADQRKDQFLATLAHELRNPLAPISYTVQTLQLDDKLEPHLHQAFDSIDRHLQQMVRLTDDLLDTSRIASGKLALRKEVVAVADVVRLAVEASQPLLDAASHTLSITLPDEPIHLEADFTRISQVLSNLLNNAAKYTNPGGHVWLEVEREGEFACLTVRDDGIGIPADVLPAIFEMFAQSGDAVARAQGGLGLGLPLVRRLVDLHGGTIEASSAGKGQGSSFRVRLPVAAEPKPATVVALPAPSTARPTNKTSILVVDDSPATATALAELMRMAGHETRTAHDGTEALALAALFNPDVVVIDLGLPNLNGCEVARRMRAQSWGQRALLIAVSGDGQEDDQRRLLEAGFDQYLVKSIEFSMLERLLAEHGSAVT